MTTLRYRAPPRAAGEGTLRCSSARERSSRNPAAKVQGDLFSVVPLGSGSGFTSKSRRTHGPTTTAKKALPNSTERNDARSELRYTPDDSYCVSRCPCACSGAQRSWLSLLDTGVATSRSAGGVARVPLEMPAREVKRWLGLAHQHLCLGARVRYNDCLLRPAACPAAEEARGCTSGLDP